VTTPNTNSHADGRDQMNVSRVRTTPTTMSTNATTRLSTLMRAALHRASTDSATR
jgi:hypothetical protein